MLWLLRPLWPQSRRCLQGVSSVIPIPRKDSIRKLIKKNEPNNLLLRKTNNHINRQTNFFLRNLNEYCICNLMLVVIFATCKSARINGQLSIWYKTNFQIFFRQRGCVQRILFSNKHQDKYFALHFNPEWKMYRVSCPKNNFSSFF